MTSPVPSAAARRPRLRKGEGRQLRDEILDAAEQLLLATGSQEAVSIRGVADAVGVTPPSIYRHFADKAELIFQVCERHFDELDVHLRRVAGSIDDPVDRLAALGTAYVEFGVANPEPYRIMFMTRPDMAPEAYQGEVQTRSSAFNLLLDSVQACIDAGRFKPEHTDTVPVALGFWARVHGLTSLMISKPGLMWPDDPRYVADYAEACLHGVVRDD